MILVDLKTGEEIKVGQRVLTFRDEEEVVKAIYKPGTSAGGNGGRVELSDQCLYFPSVINAVFMEN